MTRRNIELWLKTIGYEPHEIRPEIDPGGFVKNPIWRSLPLPPGWVMRDEGGGAVVILDADSAERVRITPNAPAVRIDPLIVLHRRYQIRSVRVAGKLNHGRLIVYDVKNMVAVKYLDEYLDPSEDDWLSWESHLDAAFRYLDETFPKWKEALAYWEDDE